MTEKHIGKVVQVTGSCSGYPFQAKDELPALLNAIEIDVQWSSPGGRGCPAGW